MPKPAAGPKGLTPPPSKPTGHPGLVAASEAAAAAAANGSAPRPIIPGRANGLKPPNPAAAAVKGFSPAAAGPTPPVAAKAAAAAAVAAAAAAACGFTSGHVAIKLGSMPNGFRGAAGVCRAAGLWEYLQVSPRVQRPLECGKQTGECTADVRSLQRSAADMTRVQYIYSSS